MRKDLLVKNTVASLLFQVTAIVCGFVLPQVFLQRFGSEVNGLVNSISQFLSVVSFLELGVGAVVQSSLYKPLADKDNRQISCVVVSADRFFRRIALVLLVYVVVLMLVYPTISNQDFDGVFTAVLIGAMSISSFAQYYFGIVDSILLTADQRGYIQYNAQTMALVLNTVVCVAMISAGCSVQMVRLVSSLIFLVRPLVLRAYVNRRYGIDWKVRYGEEPIKQKWNGVAQHVASVVLNGTDVIVLTMFSTLSNVSIYSVYYLVVSGVKTLFMSITDGFQAVLGELWAKQRLEDLDSFFGWVEWLVHTGTTFVFACTAVLIVPFVQVYTLGVNDADYVQPLFAVLLTLANAMHCMRLPYNILVLAAGHYRQTQRNYIVAVVLNVVISVLTVELWGLVGVAIGTLVAMAYQTIWLFVYDSKNLIRWPLKRVAKQFAVDALSAALIAAVGGSIAFNDISYLGWILLAVKVSSMAVVIVLSVNFIFYMDRMKQMFGRVRNRLCG